MKKSLPLILAMLLLLTFTTSAFASEPIGMIEEEPMEYLLTKPYEYPDRLKANKGEEPDSLEKRIKDYHVPQMALDNMTTEALLKTVLDYPLLINMLAYDTPQQGFEDVRDYCNGLQELWNRPDAAEVVEQFAETEECQERALYRIFAEIFLTNLRILPMDPVKPYDGYIYSPADEKIWIYEDVTWEDLDFTLQQAEKESQYLDNQYPGATKIRDKNPKYNCHSYTFHTTSSSNNIWIDGDQAETYITDGSYDPVTPARVGDKVWYSQSHSGIVERILTNGTVFVRSKWGAFGLYVHAVNDCPNRNLAGVTYYR